MSTLNNNNLSNAHQLLSNAFHFLWECSFHIYGFTAGGNSTYSHSFVLCFINCWLTNLSLVTLYYVQHMPHYGPRVKQREEATMNNEFES